MNKPRRNDPLLCMLMVLTLLLSNAMPFFALGKINTANGKMVVCSSEGGTKVIDKSETKKQHCQFCYFNLASQPGTPDIPEVAAAGNGGVISQSLFGFGGQQLQNQLHSTNLHTRAPPFFA